MVRIKHRYLLINVLYPDQETNSTSSRNQNKKNHVSAQDQDGLPWTIQFRRPSADSFNAKLLAKLIRQGVEELFGDYGAGMVAASFQGENLFSFSRISLSFLVGERGDQEFKADRARYDDSGKFYERMGGCPFALSSRRGDAVLMRKQGIQSPPISIDRTHPPIKADQTKPQKK
jgi:ribonuclease P/MRP protein subunit POP5